LGVDEGATGWGGVDGGGDSNANGITASQDSKTEVAVPTNISEVAIKKKFRPRPKTTRRSDVPRTETRAVRAPLKTAKKMPVKKAPAKSQSKAQDTKTKSKGQTRSHEVKAKSKPKTQKAQSTVKLDKKMRELKGMQGVVSGYSFEDDDEGEFTVVSRSSKRTNRSSKKKNKGRDSKRR